MKNTTAMADYELRHIEALRKDLAGCTVLLKKDGSFPLEKPCALAAYGSGVRRTIRGGTGSGEVNSRYIVTIEEGLQQAGFTLRPGWSGTPATSRLGKRPTKPF